MSFRIDLVPRPDGTVLRVSGELKESGMAELNRLCQQTTGLLSLDLSDLRAIDPRGVQLLQSLFAKGIAICGATPYLDLLLSRANDNPSPEGGR